jgi:DNA-binding MarR family transcriptional regulator
MKREQLLQALNQVMRESSTEAIMLHQAIADTLGLNITDHKCLDLVARYGPLTAGKLAELTGLTTGGITGVIDRLEKAGYARRVPDPKDRRTTIIEPVHNKEIEKKLANIFLPLSQKMENMASEYSDEELKLLVEFISKTVQGSHEITTGLREKIKEKNSRT